MSGTNDFTERRVQQLEVKLDRIEQVMIQLATVVVRQEHSDKRVERQDKRIEKIEDDQKLLFRAVAGSAVLLLLGVVLKLLGVG